MSLPDSHIAENLKLEAEGYVDLFQLLLHNGARLYLKAGNSVTWQGNTYEGTGIQITNVASYSSEQVSRPTLNLFNPNGVFSPYIRDGEMDKATCIRYRVLVNNVEADVATYSINSWTVWRPLEVNAVQGKASFELRDQMDGFNYISPARMFISPDFKTVSLR
jgi:phage-related protein